MSHSSSQNIPNPNPDCEILTKLLYISGTLRQYSNNYRNTGHDLIKVWKKKKKSEQFCVWDYLNTWSLQRATALSHKLTTLHKQAWHPASIVSLDTHKGLSPKSVAVCSLGPKPDNDNGNPFKTNQTFTKVPQCGGNSIHQRPGSPTHRPKSLCVWRLNLPMQMRQQAEWGKLTSRLVYNIINKYPSITVACTKTLPLLHDYYSLSRKWQCCHGKLAACVKLLLSILAYCNYFPRLMYVHGWWYINTAQRLIIQRGWFHRAWDRPRSEGWGVFGELKSVHLSL